MPAHMGHDAEPGATVRTRQSWQGWVTRSVVAAKDWSGRDHRGEVKAERSAGPPQQDKSRPDSASRVCQNSAI